MKVNVYLSSGKSWTHDINQDVATQELVDLWRGGAMIAAQPKQPKEATSEAKPALGAADIAFVEINLARLPLELVLAHPFTKQFLTAAGYHGDGTMGRCVLAFKLPATTGNGRRLSMVMKGLETLYAGAHPHRDVLQRFGGEGLDNFVVPGCALSAEAEKELALLGHESRAFNARQYKDIPPRSRLHLDLGTVVRWADVEADEEGYAESVLSRVPDGTEVFCPVHADAHPTAVVLRGKDGSPVVACVHCNRIYGLERSGRYDFGFSERVFKELGAEHEAAGGDPTNFVFMRERYLPSIPFAWGITCIRSGKGTGKTTRLGETVKHCKEQNLRVLLISHRRTLSQALADKLGLINYFTLVEETFEAGCMVDGEEVEDLKYELVGLERPSKKETIVWSSELARNDPADHYAISLDSLTALAPAKDRYDVIIIDECEQVFTHLISKTLLEKRSPVYLRLRHYLREAKAVYLLDADLNMVTMETLFQADIPDDTPFRIIVNEPVRRSEITHIYDDEKQLVERFMKSVAAGEKCFVPTNSINEAKRLAEVASRTRAEARVVCIHAENSQSSSMQKLIGNISAEFEEHIDVLIASPALGTGVDISYRDEAGKPRSVVQKVFGLFKRNITTHFDIDQAVMRVREPGEVHIWVDTRKQYFECDPAVLYAMLENAVRDAHHLLDFAHDGTPIYPKDDGLVDIWARITAASRGSKNDLAELYKGLRRRNGYKVVPVAYDDEAKRRGQGSLTAAREALRAERQAALLAADFIDSQTAKELGEQDANGGEITVEERFQLERYRIERFHHEDISEELIAFDDEGRVREKVRNFENLVGPEERLLEQDQEDQGLLPFDRRLRLLRRKLLSNLLGASGLYDQQAGAFSTSAEVEHQNLLRFVELMMGYRKRIELVFGLVMRRDVRTKPMIQLGEVLGLVGLALEETGVKQVSGRKTRRYRIEDQRLQEMLSVVARREEERQQWEEAEADKSDNKGITKKERHLSGEENAVTAKQASAMETAEQARLAKHKAALLRFKQKREQSNGMFSVG